MGRRKTTVEPERIEGCNHESPPDLSASAIEKRLIAKSYAEAERRIDNGTATSEMICLFLKAGSSKHFLDEQKAQAELEYTRAKVELVKSQIKTEEMIVEGINALKEYQGGDDDSDV